MSEVFSPKVLSPVMADEVLSLINQTLDERLPVSEDDGKFLSVKNASKRFDIPEQTIRKWLSQGRLKSYPSKVGRLIRIKVSELMELEK